MKKAITLIALTTTIISCKAQTKPIMKSETTVVTTNEMLVGKRTKEELLKLPYNLWYNPNHDNYKPDASIINDLKKNIRDISITVFMGTWCEDSQQQVPHFYKILEALQFDDNNVTLITVDKNKTTPEQFEKGLNITNVPTFIIYKDGKELHRIVERPMETLEKDMHKIVTGQPYKHAYEN